MSSKNFHGVILVCCALTVFQGCRAQNSNIEIVKKWHEIVDGKDFSKLSEIEEADVVNENPSGGFTGIEAHKQMMTGFATAFPNYVHNSTKYIVQDNTVAFEGTFSGDHTGPFMMGKNTIPATGKKVEFTYSGFITISENDKVESIHFYFDTYSFLSQLDIL